MTIKISNSTRGKHRDTHFIATARVYHDDTQSYDFYINDYPIAIAKLKDDKWWLIPNWDDQEDLVEDIGPYDTEEQAAVMLRLQSTHSVLVRD